MQCMDNPRQLLLEALGTGAAADPLPRVRRALLVVVFVAVSIAICFFLHFNLSTAGSIELLVVLSVAMRWGFAQATLASVLSVLCLNFLFTPPVFQFSVADPQNWVSLATFEAIALMVSLLSSRVRLYAETASAEHDRTSTLYGLSRAILLIDNHTATTQQLATLIREFLKAEDVIFRIDADALNPDPSESSRPDTDDLIAHHSRRVLRTGTTAIGSMTLSGWQIDPLLADAVASLSAIAIERERAIQRENRADAERRTEQLRAAVLDGLAHGFKTPLTAIQTASSGLLAINHLTATQAELVSIIDDQATLLNQMTTRLLQTAALEGREMRLHRHEASMLEIAEQAISRFESHVRTRIRTTAPAHLEPDDVDAELIALALDQLLDNASKYSAIETPIEVHLTQQPHETAVVIRNSGVPIPAEEQERIFQRFYRSAGGAHGPTGTGVGLSIVKKVAEAHGGATWVECDNDLTSFYFTVPHHRKAHHGKP